MSETPPAESNPAPRSAGALALRRRRRSTAKRILFGTISTAAFFLVLEGLLFLLGVETVAMRNPAAFGLVPGFRVFERDGERFRTVRFAGPRTFNDQSFLAEKPPNGLRIFTLGDSSAFGYPWGGDVAFTAILSDVLAESLPGRVVECVNAAGVSYGMQRLQAILPEILSYSTDIIVVYCGHNEFIEHNLLRLTEERSAEQPVVDLLARFSRLHALLSSVLTRENDEERFQVLEASVRRDESRSFSAAEKERIVARFDESLGALVTAAARHDVRVVLATVPCNLRDWAPNRALLEETLPPEALERVEHALDSARQVPGGTPAPEATLELLESALALAPKHPQLRYELGRLLLARGDRDRAQRELEAACDLDASPNRRLTGINDAIRKTAERQGALLIDCDRLIADASEQGIPGFEWIEDYVHPNRKGHELIAWHILERMRESRWLGEDIRLDRAGFDAIVARRRPEETTGSTWYFNQGFLFERRGLLDKAVAMYEAALESSPTHPGALANLAHLSTNRGNPARGLEYSERLIARDPRTPSAHLARANALAHLGRTPEAVEAYRGTLALDLDSTVANVNLGLALVRMYRDDEALGYFERALAQQGTSMAALLESGSILMRRREFGEAEARFRRAVSVDPKHAVAHCRRGQALIAAERREEGLMALARARELAPKPIRRGTEIGDALAAAGLLEE